MKMRNVNVNQIANEIKWWRQKWLCSNSLPNMRIVSQECCIPDAQVADISALEIKHNDGGESTSWFMHKVEKSKELVERNAQTFRNQRLYLEKLKRTSR